MRQEITSFTTMFDLKYFSPFSHINLPGCKVAVIIRQDLNILVESSYSIRKHLYETAFLMFSTGMFQKKY